MKPARRRELSYKGERYDTPEYIEQMRLEYTQDLVLYATKALTVLAKLLDDEDPKIRLGAANSLLDRTWGKANQPIDVATDGNGAIGIILLPVIRDE